MATNETRFIGMNRKDLIAEIESLEKRIEGQRITIETYLAEKEDVQKLKNELNRKLSEEYWKPKTNERGAGRKPKITRELHSEIMGFLNAGNTYRQVAENLKISVGLVGKANGMSRAEINKLPFQNTPCKFTDADAPIDGQISL